MCNSFKHYSVKKNVENWIGVAIVYSVIGLVLPMEDPLIIWVFGISLGYMTMWAQEIFHNWIKTKY